MCLWSRVSNCKQGSPCMTVCLGWWVCPCVHTCVVILGEALVSPPSPAPHRGPLVLSLDGVFVPPLGVPGALPPTEPRAFPT